MIETHSAPEHDDGVERETRRHRWVARGHVDKEYLS
jgi:hypothetical protein